MPRSNLTRSPRRLRREGWRALGPIAAALALLAGAPAGCAPAQLPVRLQIEEGDRQRDWGLLYYQSWQKERSRVYLRLARERTQEAILTYLDAQRRMGYSYPDFYLVDHRRMASCLFLTRMQREAAGYGMPLDAPRRAGCFD